MKASKTQIAHYRKFRAIGGTIVGQSAVQAWRDASILDQWENAENQGLVRLRAEPEPENYFSVYGEPETEDEREEIVRQLDLYGCWRCISEYLDERGQWQHADSIGMITGYSNPLSPFKNCYITDLMSNALDKVTEPEFNI